LAHKGLRLRGAFDSLSQSLLTCSHRVHQVRVNQTLPQDLARLEKACKVK